MGLGGGATDIGRFRKAKEQRERKHHPFFVRQAGRNITFSITGINVIKNWENLRKDSSQTFLGNRTQTPIKAGSRFSSALFRSFRDVLINAGRDYSTRGLSSGDAFLAPKRENTVSPILFHFTRGQNWEGERGKEGRR